MIDLYLLDKNFNPIYSIDTYDSCIWTDRFNEAGDFEIVATINDKDDWYSHVEIGQYISNNLSIHTMCIEKIEVNRDEDDSHQIIISGHSLEYILNRRIVWERYPYPDFDYSKLGDTLHWLIDSNICAPNSNPIRVIPGAFVAPNVRKDFNVYNIDTQNYFGQNLYDTVKNLCQMYNLGFRLLKINTGMRFEVYEMKMNYDYIYNEEYDNLVSSQYVKSNENWLNCIRYSGTDANDSDYFMEINGATGIDRRETYLNTGVNQKYRDTDDEEKVMSNDVFRNMMTYAAIKELNEHTKEHSINGEVNPRYLEKFNLGDMFMLEDQNDQTIIFINEIIYSNDSNGFSVYPTFVFL